jgi:hypothetical protein
MQSIRAVAFSGSALSLHFQSQQEAAQFGYCKPLHAKSVRIQHPSCITSISTIFSPPNIHIKHFILYYPSLAGSFNTMHEVVLNMCSEHHQALYTLNHIFKQFLIFVCFSLNS